MLWAYPSYAGDNSLLVLENIDRYIAMGEMPAAAAVRGLGDRPGVTASALTNIVVFTPSPTCRDRGQFFKQFGLTVVFATSSPCSSRSP